MSDDPYDFSASPDSKSLRSGRIEDDRESVDLSLAEEILEARVVERRQGTVRIQTRVETDRVKAAVDLHSDAYVVDHIAVDEDASKRREPWYEGDALMIPIYEEVLVTHTQLVLKEVIRLRNKGHVERVNLKGTVRRDVVDISESDR